MKKLIVILAGVLLLAGCFDYVEPKDTHIKVEETHASDLNARTERTERTESVSISEADRSQTEAEVVQTEEVTETETERETITIYVTQGVNIRAQQTKLSDRLGGAGFGESFTAYTDTLNDEFVEIIFEDGTAYMYGRCITTNYDVISEMRAEIARQQAETQTQVQTEIIIETNNIMPENAETSQKTEENMSETEMLTEKETETYSAAVYTPDYFKQMGVLNWGGSKWTWYSEQILPGEGLWIPGRHLDENGYVCDENGYICCAADLSYIPRYTVIETPFGKLGKIYDTGCAYGVVDVYVHWLP